MSSFRFYPIRVALLVMSFIFAFVSSAFSADEESFVGRWAFELPDGNPAWMKIDTVANGFEGQLLWSVGSARPVKNLRIQDGSLSFQRKIRWKPFGEEPVKEVLSPIKGRIDSGKLMLTVRQRSAGSQGGDIEEFVIRGKLIPPMPVVPDLSKVVFGQPIDLLGEGMKGWRLTNSKKKNGWRLEGEVLVNETPKTDFGAYGSYGNLRTVKEFEDFELLIDYNVEAGGNSGVYLRGMYEAQVVDRDSKMQGVHGPGAIFGRIKPSKNAANAPGQWNRYRLLLVDRHITVQLNGVTVVDNQALEGCTGGGILADDTRPGPIFLQGDHTSVRYRNVMLRPVQKTGK